jgi:hypothetical protein
MEIRELELVQEEPLNLHSSDMEADSEAGLACS